MAEEIHKSFPGVANGTDDLKAIAIHKYDPSSSDNCYCGKPRNIAGVEFLCGLCLKWFHSQCVSCFVGSVVPLLTNYQFFCKKCSPSCLESFNKKQASFSQMCHTSLANQILANPGRFFFSKDTAIIPYIDKYWESLTTMPRRIKLTWHTTIAKTMLKDNDIFSCNDAGLFGLVNPDLYKIGPNYDNLLKSIALGTYRSDEKRHQTESKSTEPKRATKRKAPDLSSHLTKSRKADIVTAKVAPHGFPLDHPYNKDGYRYILAESDPHAPNRQAFDESIEWASKPIPGFLYRSFLSTRVLLAMHDRAPQLKLDDHQLSVTGEKGYSMIRATHGVRRGAWYYEVKVKEMPQDSATRIGWSQSLGNLQAPCGYDKFSYSWRSRKGTRFHDSRGKHYSDGYAEGDVLGFYISFPTDHVPLLSVPPVYKDKPLITFKSHLYFEEKEYVPESVKNLKPLESSKIVFYKNGISQGVAWTDIYEGIYYPTISLYKNATVAVNFGPDFEFPPQTSDAFEPMSQAATNAMVEHAVGDIIFHIENEGNIPDF